MLLLVSLPKIPDELLITPPLSSKLGGLFLGGGFIHLVKSGSLVFFSLQSFQLSEAADTFEHELEESEYFALPLPFPNT